MKEFILQAHVAEIMTKRGLNNKTSLREFQEEIKKEFNEEYTQDEIETALNEIEDSILVKIHEQEYEIFTLDKEDYE